MSPAPAVFDERWAIWAAASVAPRSTASRAQAGELSRQVRQELPALDQAARRVSALGSDLAPAEVQVLGRMGWVRANLASMAGMLEPLRPRLADRPGARQVLGLQLGAVFGLLSSKVLGQFILPLGSAESDAGRLVVVGPNVVALAERHAGLADDARRAVVLHELTHRLQLAAAPWLTPYLQGVIAEYLAHVRVDPDALKKMTMDAPRIVAKIRSTGTVQPLLHAMLTEEQAALLDQAQALMTLLEGHGNTVMFDAGAEFFAEPAQVRAALQSRRNDLATRLLTQLFGLDAKRRQYRDGEAFVRAVVDQAGFDGLNRAFRDPDSLPKLDEITDAAAWLRRVGP